MSLQKWLTYLETLHPKAIDLGLERVKQVAQTAQLLSPSYFVITVAGTNGKGTSVALLEAVLSAAGYRVASYTSPHLLRYNERVKIKGIAVDDSALCEAFTAIEAARAHTSLTYFEFGTLAALWLFKQMPLDVVILEVGLGGRLDAVNIIDADIALISTIALDHMEYLGSNREAIGREKAGILRAHQAAVCGDFDVPASILRYAQQLQTPLYVYGKDYTYQQNDKDHWQWQSELKQLMALPIPNIPLQNAAAVLKVLELLPDNFSINKNHIIASLQKVQVAGRFQIIPGAIPCILDVAHNPAAAGWLADKLQQTPGHGRTLAVIGMLADKDHQATVKPLVEQITEWYVGGLSVTRGMAAPLLAQAMIAAGIKTIKIYDTVVQAYNNAVQQAQPGDRILVFGSFYTVAQVMQLRL